MYLELTNCSIMSIFSFIKDAGIKIKELPDTGGHAAAQSREKGETDTPEWNPAAAERLKALLEEYQLNVDELSLQVDGERVIVSGNVKKQEVREKVILALGNVQGISEVVEELSPEDGGDESFFHTVQPADTLKSISEKAFGVQGKEEVIIDANTPFVKSAKDIFPGMVLRIPSAERRREKA